MDSSLHHWWVGEYDDIVAPIPGFAWYRTWALITGNTLCSRVVNLALGKNLTGSRALWKDVPVPEISFNEILVKVRAVALNATGFKHIDAISPPDYNAGCDCACEVYKVGKGASQF
jgi:hypothetical protein